MNTKFVDLTEFYKFSFHKKIVTQKLLSHEGVLLFGELFNGIRLARKFERHVAIVAYQLRAVSGKSVKVTTLH